MFKTTLLAAAAALAFTATPAVAQKETRVGTTVVQPQVVERVVVREVPVVRTVTVPAVRAARANDRFVGLRADINAGVDGIGEDEDFTYGLTVGGDLPVGSRVTLGADLDLQRPLEDRRQLGAGVRLGYAVTPQALVFARAGYAHTDLDNGGTELDLSGLTLGGGAEFATGRNTYITTEYRYTDYNHGMNSHGARVGFGVRF